MSAQRWRYSRRKKAFQSSWNVAAGSSATASLACVPTWHEDFRNDLARVDVPTLVIHGDADRILPINASGSRTAKLIKGARLLVVKDGPHCVTWTHAEEVNRELVTHIRPEGAGKRARLSAFERSGRRKNIHFGVMLRVAVEGLGIPCWRFGRRARRMHSRGARLPSALGDHMLSLSSGKKGPHFRDCDQ